MATAAPPKSPVKKSKDEYRFTIVKVGPVGGKTSTAVLPVPNPLPDKLAAVLRYLSEAQYLLKQQKVVQDFFKEAETGMTEEEVADMSTRVAEGMDTEETDKISVISEIGSISSEGSGYLCMFQRTQKIKQMVSEEVNRLKERFARNNPLRPRSPSPTKEPMDLVSFAKIYKKKIDKINVLLAAYGKMIEDFQNKLPEFRQPEVEAIFYVDFREKDSDPMHHKMIIRETWVKRVEHILSTAILILKASDKIGEKLLERNPDLYEDLQARIIAATEFEKQQPQS